MHVEDVKFFDTIKKKNIRVAGTTCPGNDTSLSIFPGKKPR